MFRTDIWCRLKSFWNSLDPGTHKSQGFAIFWACHLELHPCEGSLTLRWRSGAFHAGQRWGLSGRGAPSFFSEHQPRTKVLAGEGHWGRNGNTHKAKALQAAPRRLHTELPVLPPRTAFIFLLAPAAISPKWTCLCGFLSSGNLIKVSFLYFPGLPCQRTSSILSSFEGPDSSSGGVRSRRDVSFPSPLKLMSHFLDKDALLWMIICSFHKRIP